jgi:hypothetical protein
MASKKKTSKKSTKSKKTAVRKKSTKKPAQKRRTPKKLPKRKATPSKATAKSKGSKKPINVKIADAARKTRKKSQGRNALGFSGEASRSRSGEQSGDLQGLSNVESADSESVDELMEEGNAFEAGVVAGVEEAGGSSEREVRTREVPEDDVPGEYLDEE